MENDNANGQKKPAKLPAAKMPAPVKVPMAKRAKVPPARVGTPAPHPAAPASPADSAQKPVTDADPAAQIEAEHPSTTEPELPHEEKKENTASPVEAHEIEKTPPRKRRRGMSSASKSVEKESEEDAQDEEKEDSAQQVKEQIKRVLSNKWCKLGLAVVLFGLICSGIYSSLPKIAEKKLPEIFAANGMAFKNFKIKELTIDTMELTNVSDQTGSISISNMKFKYSLKELYSENVIQSVELSGVTMNGERNEDNISLGALSGFIYSPVNTKKGNEITIGSIQVRNGKFVLKDNTPPKKIINAEGEEEEVDSTVTVGFSANGRLMKTGLNLQISTDYNSEQMVVKTQTSLNKTLLNSQIKTEITEGRLIQNAATSGSVAGNLEVSVTEGVLTKGQADLQLTSSSQKLNLQADVIPKNDKFDITMKLERLFENPKDAIGKFVGNLSLEAKDVTVKGTFQNFEGTLPLLINAPLLTTGKLSVHNLTTDANVKFSCAGAICTVNLIKPLEMSFSALQASGNFKQFKLYTPLSLTVNPDPKEPFMKSNGGNLSFALPFSSFSTQLFIIDHASGMQAATALNGLKTNLEYNIFSGKYSGTASFVQSGFANKDMKLVGVQGTTAFNSETLPDVRLRVAKFSLTKPDVLPDFAADVRFRPMGPAEFGVDSTIAIQNGLLTATLNGSYMISSHEWNLYLVVPKFALADGGLTLENVMPFMLQYLPPTTYGNIAAKGRLSVRDGKITGPLEVLMENVDTTWKGLGIESLNGVVTLSSLLPLETPENQQIFVGTLNTGIPFQNALFNFRILPKTGVEVANARMKYANGQFKTIKSFSIPYEGHTSQILFEGSGIDLATVTKNLKSPALQVDGIFNSEWQLRYTDQKLNVENVKFTSKLPGTLHFTPPDDLRKKMDPQMVTFLKDLIVKEMTITAKGVMDGTLMFDTFITGHSPLETAEDGQDVSFDFSGSFKNFLKQEGGLMEIPSDILLMMQNYQKK